MRKKTSWGTIFFLQNRVVKFMRKLFGNLNIDSKSDVEFNIQQKKGCLYERSFAWKYNSFNLWMWWIWIMSKLQGASSVTSLFHVHIKDVQKYKKTKVDLYMEHKIESREWQMQISLFKRDLIPNSQWAKSLNTWLIIIYSTSSIRCLINRVEWED